MLYKRWRFKTLHAILHQTIMTHLATALRDPLITLSFENPWTGNIPTILIGVVNEHYLDEEFDRHKQRILHLFKITDSSYLLEIRASSTGFGSRVLDDHKLGEDMATTIQTINCLETDQLRIIHLGVGNTVSVDDSIESLIRGWDKPLKEKKIQFIALGESSDFHLLNFCKGLCMKQLCGYLQFYSTMDFTNYGYFDVSKTIMTDSHIVEHNLDPLMFGNQAAYPYGDYH